MESRISKKVLSLLLVMTVMCGLLFTTTAVADEEESSNSFGSTIITTVEQLAAMTDGDYVLGANITIEASSWEPISNFTGTFDGGVYTITWSDTTEDSELEVDSYFAIFGTNSGTISNLRVDGELYVTGTSVDYVSTVVGYNIGTITNVTNEATLYADNTIYNVGGIAGYNVAIISYCANEASVTGYSQVGGIVGENAGTIEVCSNTGDIYGTRTSKSGIGGIAGRNGDNNTATTTAIIRNCYNQGNITSGTSSGRGSWVGGISGFQNSLSSSTNCYNTGNLLGSNYVDHTAGNNEGTVTNCYGLSDAEHQTGAQGNDDTTPEDYDYMQSQSFVNTLNTNAGATLWVYKENTYPTLVAYTPSESYTFTVSKQPTKTTYSPGETFDPAGMEILAIDTAGEAEEVEDYSINPSRALLESDTYVIVLGTYKGVPFSLIVSITVSPATDVYLDGTATADGDGTREHPFNKLSSALAKATTTGGTIIVMGTVSISEEMTCNDDVTIKRDTDEEGNLVFTGTLFDVNVEGGNYVTLTSMTIDGGGSGTLFAVNSGNLQLRGNITLTNCEVAVDVRSGGAVDVNRTSITASQYSIKVADGTSTFTLDDYGGTTISGTVYLGSGAYITVGAAVPNVLTVECTGFQTGTTPITVAIPASGVTLTASMFEPSDEYYSSSIDSDGNVIFSC